MGRYLRRGQYDQALELAITEHEAAQIRAKRDTRLAPPEATANPPPPGG